MKYFKSILQFSGLLLLIVLLSSCGEKKDSADTKAMDASGMAQVEKKEEKSRLAHAVSASHVYGWR